MTTLANDKEFNKNSQNESNNNVSNGNGSSENNARDIEKEMNGLSDSTDTTGYKGTKKVEEREAEQESAVKYNPSESSRRLVAIYNRYALESFREQIVNTGVTTNFALNFEMDIESECNHFEKEANRYLLRESIKLCLERGKEFNEKNLSLIRSELKEEVNKRNQLDKARKNIEKAQEQLILSFAAVKGISIEEATAQVAAMFKQTNTEN